jgi:hypothetical protein
MNSDLISIKKIDKLFDLYHNYLFPDWSNSAKIYVVRYSSKLWNLLISVKSNKCVIKNKFKIRCSLQIDENGQAYSAAFTGWAGGIILQT